MLGQDEGVVDGKDEGSSDGWLVGTQEVDVWVGITVASRSTARSEFICADMGIPSSVVSASSC